MSHLAIPPRSSSAGDRLVDAVAQLSAFFCTEEFFDSRSSSTLLVYFSGILGFTHRGTTFERPRNYTSKLSALIYCVRLCLLEFSLPRSAHPAIGWEVRPRTGNLRRLNKVRERFMCYGCQAPMGELLSLRAYGRAISHSDGPCFRVQWSEDSETVAWEHGRLEMDQLRRLGSTAVQSATTSMARLMYGLAPAIKLESVRDQISSQRQGYSFVRDPANQLDTAYLDLSSRACLNPLDGLMASESWQLDAVRRYLSEETNLLVQLMLMLYLRGGQAARTTEFFSIECYNGPSTSRGVYVHDGSIVYITRHSKAWRATNHEFQVARYLPRQDSELLATYLVYVRPFTDMLYRVCYGQNRERRLLFASSERPERPWTADVLTKALKLLTQDVCGTPFGVQVYRQLSVAVTERHIKHISRPFNRYDDKSTEADREVAFSWQSGHRPLQRGTVYGIDAAFPDSLQPALLRVYQWASIEWHNFLGADNNQLHTATKSKSTAAFSNVPGETGNKRRTVLPRQSVMASGPIIYDSMLDFEERGAEDVGPVLSLRQTGDSCYRGAGFESLANIRPRFPLEIAPKTARAAGHGPQMKWESCSGNQADRYFESA